MTLGTLLIINAIGLTTLVIYAKKIINLYQSYLSQDTQDLVVIDNTTQGVLNDNSSNSSLVRSTRTRPLSRR